MGYSDALQSAISLPLALSRSAGMAEGLVTGHPHILDVLMNFGAFAAELRCYASHGAVYSDRVMTISKSKCARW